MAIDLFTEFLMTQDLKYKSQSSLEMNSISLTFRAEKNAAVDWNSVLPNKFQKQSKKKKKIGTKVTFWHLVAEWPVLSFYQLE